ncbi:hypothetical protein [Wolbachia pipientis]|uniref:hypothetical protein n=1 Tax=Wolbachia pipientis TaxID=955 RepID=UPI0016510F95|nr:hypothetical protein [Wolbachia pipientis]
MLAESMLRYRAQLYEHSFLKVNCTANGVIPVWNPAFSSKTAAPPSSVIPVLDTGISFYFMMMS